MQNTKFLKADKKSAQRAHAILIQNSFLDKNYKVEKDKFNVYFPIKKEKIPQLKAKIKNAKIVQRKAQPQKPLTRPLKDILKQKLSKEDLQKLPSSYDLVGSIAVLEIPKELKPKEKEIAQALLDANKNIKTVAQKSSTQGGYRIRKITPILGDATTEAIAKESGRKFLVDLNKAYYTPRLSTERLRIAKEVAMAERVLVPFSGVCPFPIAIEKNSQPLKIYAIEKNPHAHEFALQNIKINKCKKIKAVNADAKEELKREKYRGWADRIIMPHPTQSLQFFAQCLNALKDGGAMHIYAFAKPKNFEKELFSNLHKIAKKQSFSLELLSSRVARPYSKDLVQAVLVVRAYRQKGKPKAPSEAKRK